jgi:hypothetical protein
MTWPSPASNMVIISLMLQITTLCTAIYKIGHPWYNIFKIETKGKGYLPWIEKKS